MQFRPRFSVRTLAVFVTLVCAYFGAWEATKRYAESQITTVNGWRLFHDTDAATVHEVFAAEAPGPFIVYLQEQDCPTRGIWIVDSDWNCYVWLLGPKIKLPFSWMD